MTPLKHSESAIEQARLLRNQCDMFLATTGDQTVSNVQAFVDALQARFSSARAGFAVVRRQRDPVTFYNLVVENAPSDMVAAFTAAHRAGQVVAAEYATNVAPLRAVDTFNATTGLHEPATLTQANIARMKSAVTALRTALDVFT